MDRTAFAHLPLQLSDPCRYLFLKLVVLLYRGHTAHVVEPRWAGIGARAYLAGLGSVMVVQTSQPSVTWLEQTPKTLFRQTIIREDALVYAMTRKYATRDSNSQQD